MTNALIIVDMQLDFIYGSLKVEGGEGIVQPIVDLAKDFDLVIASQDWHPADHFSFEECGGTWPTHCVRGTTGASLHPAINEVADLIVRKGTNKNIEAYSAFSGTCLRKALSAATHVVVCGLATDYCVRQTALDARRGIAVTVPLDLCRGVDPETTADAIESMKAHGVVVV